MDASGRFIIRVCFASGVFLLTVNRENNAAEKIYITPRCFLFVILCGHFYFLFATAMEEQVFYLPTDPA
ncbi:hypothetical protein ACM1AR_004847, partial [Escherichia coli]